MSEVLEKPITLRLISVHESPSSSSSSTAEGLEPTTLRRDLPTQDMPEGLDGARQRTKVGESAPAVTCFKTEKDSVESKHDLVEAASLFLGHHASRGASPSPALLHDAHKSHAYVTNQYISAMYRLWTKNRSYLLVIIATIFGSAMTLFTKLLESGQHAMHPLRILFLRMAVTSILCFTPLYFRKDGGSPFGPRELRWLLVFRGTSGFFGLCGIWMSISTSPEVPN